MKSALLAVALAAAGCAFSAATLAGASLAVGLLATAAQDLVPAAAAVAEPASRGRTVGTVMTGLLLGILLSRVVSGAVTLYASWRGVFLGASVTVALFTVVAARVLPAFPPTTSDSYFALLGSMGKLVRNNSFTVRALLLAPSGV